MWLFKTGSFLEFVRAGKTGLQCSGSLQLNSHSFRGFKTDRGQIQQLFVDLDYYVLYRNTWGHICHMHLVDIKEEYTRPSQDRAGLWLNLDSEVETYKEANHMHIFNTHTPHS